jgi:hypothetical protein
MKKTIRISVKIRKCDIIFKEGMEEGELGNIDYIYDLDPEEYDNPRFAVDLLEKGEELQKELIEINAKVIEDETENKDKG